MCVESFFFLKAIGSKSLFVGVAVSFDLYPRVVIVWTPDPTREEGSGE